MLLYMVRYGTVRECTVPLPIRYGTVLYGTLPYGMVHLPYGTVPYLKPRNPTTRRSGSYLGKGYGAKSREILERRGAALMGYDNDRREAPRIKAL